MGRMQCACWNQRNNCIYVRFDCYQSKIIVTIILLWRHIIRPVLILQSNGYKLTLRIRIEFCLNVWNFSHAHDSTFIPQNKALYRRFPTFFTAICRIIQQDHLLWYVTVAFEQHRCVKTMKRRGLNSYDSAETPVEKSCCEGSSEHSGSKKLLRNTWVPEQLVASQHGFSSMYSDSYTTQVLIREEPYLKNAVYCDVAHVRTDVSHEHIASIIRAKRNSDVGITLAVSSNCSTLRIARYC
jgi:hypothetical protein